MSSDEDNTLAHYGVEGMRWGQRKRELAKPNEGYTNDQRKRDQQVYGRGGVKRINKNLNSGDSISTARGSEKLRRDTVLGRNKYVRQGGKVAGAVGSVVLANVGISALAKLRGGGVVDSFISKKFGYGASTALGQGIAFLKSPQGRALTSTGAAYVGQMMAGDIAVSVNTRAGGYNPNRKY